MLTGTLINDFHSTAIKVPTGHIVTAATVKRWGKRLCGSKTCTCGGVRGGDYGVKWIDSEFAMVVEIDRRVDDPGLDAIAFDGLRP